MTPWTWDPTGGPARLRAELALHGYTVLRTGEVAREAALAPWVFAERLLRETPRMVERQPIRPVERGRSFASTDGFTPPHTDSQLHFGAPPAVQLMACARPAARGGETLLVDAWALCESIERDDPALFDALLCTPRRVPFVFGDVFGPTLALRGGALAFTHSPMPPGNDPVAARLAPFVERAPRVELRVEAGEVLAVDNHRMLHGRRAFRDPAREFVRLLVWLGAPCGEHPRFREMASAVHERSREGLEGAPLYARARFGVVEPHGGEAARRLRVVLEMLRGTAPGLLATREGVAEGDLYTWRDAALAGALDAVGAVDRSADEASVAAALEAVRDRGR